MAKLIVLATYWNEEEWIESSLAQIESINADVSVICDGCFDPKKANYSTDSTRKRIETFCFSNSKAMLFNALRVTRYQGLRSILLKGLRKALSFPLLLRIMKHFARTNIYRINQAVTFNKMLEVALASLENPDHEEVWFMTVDADQFYSDETISKLRKREFQDGNIGLLTAKELTFNESYNNYTDAYEKRTWNNMPHKLYKNTLILPTRDILLVSFFSISKYIDKVSHIDLGFYFHYKFREDRARLDAGYNLGDRKKPEAERAKDTKFFTGNHPSIIKKRVG